MKKAEKESKTEKTSWLTDFKNFIMRGNVLDMAVGVVIGAAFTSIVTALVECVINPVIGVICGGIDFSGLTVGLFPIGGLISAVINFVIIAFVVFWMVRIINRVMSLGKKEKEPEPAPAPPEPSNEEKLLMEIRDLLKEKN